MNNFPLSRRIFIVLSLIVVGFNQNAFCKTAWIESTTIHSLDIVLQQAKKQIHFSSTLGKIISSQTFVAFPKYVSATTGQRLYANSQVRANYASITIGNTQNCNGEKSCLVTSLIFEPQLNPVIVYDAANKKITRLVSLNHQIDGYLTKEYALGSTFPASLVWRDGFITYTLSSWPSLPAPNAELVNMANSVINNVHKRKSQL